MSEFVVDLRDLGHVYPDATVALSAVSLRVAAGECVGIVGANGAGKSTLLLHLNGCLLPTTGEVQLGGQRVETRSLPAIRRSVGLVFQDPDDQLFMATVFEDVAFGPLNLGFSRAEAERVTQEALSRVGAWPLRDRAPYRLSVGERKRVAIATVLSMSPEVLVLDEPTAGLDPFARREILGLIRNFGQTTIIASHDLDMVAELCPRIVVLDQGRVVADRSAREIFADQALLERCRLAQPLSLQHCPLCGAPGKLRGRP
ncbi:energy-coupling factor ABC transporter ATP-binding protein [Accumulibacter sp.]|uniref:energy-coupling factor ABC transporter ATP-binding protein n=1 Tax=Accumulibacter sp. TaxID=2053492 RepID=UPI0025E3DE92|nr:ABC transporter ATP-binding protein [Accumulibacter sp.]MCM8593871.1 energy-coupling factor ABC transporter ATP-binding protein [Accumulibacter sp.]MCM8626087.1 energy-coupling factor ABC transporter ATP-binding protein [Accumulibacter sp.]MDS4048012.1 ABC transporter ATP-binding protein [Accumulibacter sp.]